MQRICTGDLLLVRTIVGASTTGDELVDSKAQNAQVWLNWALGLGVAGFFLADIGIVPLVAIGVNIKAWTVAPQAGAGTWKAVVGTAASGLGFLSYLAMYGYF